MAYRDLSIRERHAIIRAGVANGVRNLADIEARYNDFTDPAKHPDYDIVSYVRENPSAVFTHPKDVHFTDKYKLPNHPTFSDESVYTTQQTPGGHWNLQEKTFEPSTYMLDTYGSTPTIERLRRDDPDYTAVYEGGVLMPDVEVHSYANGGIHIKPSKRGTFTAAATKHGKSVQAFASQVLAHKENYSPAMVRKAVFAHNSKSWKHADGGYLADAAHWHDGNSDTQYLNAATGMRLDTEANTRTYNDALDYFTQLGFKDKNASDLALQYAADNIQYDAGMLPEVTVIPNVQKKVIIDNGIKNIHHAPHTAPTTESDLSKIAAGAIGIPMTSIVAAPLVGEGYAGIQAWRAAHPVLSGLVDAGLTLDGVRNARSDNGVKKTIKLVNEGNYGRAVLSGIGDTFDIVGGTRYLTKPLRTAASTFNKLSSVKTAMSTGDKIKHSVANAFWDIPIITELTNSPVGKLAAYKGLMLNNGSATPYLSNMLRNTLRSSKNRELELELIGGIGPDEPFNPYRLSQLYRQGVFGNSKVLSKYFPSDLIKTTDVPTDLPIRKTGDGLVQSYYSPESTPTFVLDTHDFGVSPRTHKGKISPATYRLKSNNYTGWRPVHNTAEELTSDFYIKPTNEQSKLFHHSSQDIGGHWERRIKGKDDYSEEIFDLQHFTPVEYQSRWGNDDFLHTLGLYGINRVWTPFGLYFKGSAPPHYSQGGQLQVTNGSSLEQTQALDSLLKETLGLTPMSGKKSTGGPLYPFSFSKRPLPPVRY